MTTKCTSMHLPASAVIYSLYIGYKNIQSSRLCRMKIISAWATTHFFFHGTGEYYTKTASKAIIRHLNHSKASQPPKIPKLGQSRVCFFPSWPTFYSQLTPKLHQGFQLPFQQTCRAHKVAVSYLRGSWYALISRYQPSWLLTFKVNLPQLCWCQWERDTKKQTTKITKENEFLFLL